MTYLNKYSCSDCNNTVWAIGNPLQCERCAGTLVQIEQGTTPLPAGVAYRHDVGEVQFDWDNFNEWWGSENG